MDQNLLLQIELQVAIPLLLGLVGLGLAWMRKRLKLQEDSTANQAIQNAVGNFAGKVARGMATGSISKSNAISMLSEYLDTSVGESMDHLKPTVLALETMLMGKIATIIGPQPVTNTEG